MSDQFFMPLGKEVLLLLVDNKSVTGIFSGFVSFSGIPAVYLYSEHKNQRKETLVPINQIITFEVTKPKTLIL